MRKLVYLIVVMVALGLIVAGCTNPVVPPAEQKYNENNPNPNLNEFILGDLVAGQDINIGKVTVSNDDEYLYVIYDTTGGDWVITETHLAVVTDPDEFPMTKKGNPKVGHFPYGKENISTDIWEETIKLGDIPAVARETLYIAAQAEVKNSNTGEEETAWGYGTRFTEPSNWATYFKWTPPLKVGDSFGGGIVAYIFADVDDGYVADQTHGLIAATEDQSDGIVWATADYQNSAVLDVGLLPTIIGSGSANTDAIIAQNVGVSTNYAAGLARAYNGGDYDDWFLPSQKELYKLYLNRAAIGGFADGVKIYYWSSSEINGRKAYYQDFTDGAKRHHFKKNTYRVRAVRAF